MDILVVIEHHQRSFCAVAIRLALFILVIGSSQKGRLVGI